MYSEVPLALSTTFSLIGAGSFMVLAILIRAPRLEQKYLRNIDTLSLIPGLAVVLGLVAAFFGLQDQTNSVLLLRDLGDTTWFIAAGIGGLFAFSVVIYCLRVNFGKITETRRKLMLSVVGLLGLLLVGVIGIVHMMVADPSWGTLATPLQIFGFALLGGSALAAMMFEKAGALGSPSIKGTLTFFAIIGAVLSIGGFALQVVTVLGMDDAMGAGAGLVQSVSMQIVVGFFCFVATFIFEMMAIRMKETGFHSVISVACVFVGVFCARLVFYALQITWVS